MLNDEQQTALTDIFRTIFNIPDLELNDDMTARDIMAWDSINHINLMIAIEDEFVDFLPGQTL